MSNFAPYPTDIGPSANYANKINPSAPPPLVEQPPPYQATNYSNFSNLSREEKFRDIINKHEISQFWAGKLQLLNMYKIVFVFDDSGSMNATLNDSPLNTGLMKATRWNELEYFSKISIEIANIFNENGSDVFFLNRPIARCVRTPDDLIPYFQNKPKGYTPISRVLRDVLNNNSPSVLGERKLLIILVTDGEPTDDDGRVNIQTFKEILKSRPNNAFTTVVSCTDEEETMNYLNNWDRTIPRLDVVDDFRSERVEIQKKKGSNFRFSFGDYVVKSMIGSIDVSMDKWDENAGSCCNVL